MVWWTGKGLLAVVFWVAGLGLTVLVVNSLARDSSYYQQHVWPKLLGCSISAPLIWAVGRGLNAPSQGEQRRPPPQQARARKRARRRGGAPEEPRDEWPLAAHSFLSIPMEYWAGLFPIIGVLYAVATWAADR